MKLVCLTQKKELNANYLGLFAWFGKKSFALIIQFWEVSHIFF